MVPVPKNLVISSVFQLDHLFVKYNFYSTSVVKIGFIFPGLECLKQKSNIHYATSWTELCYEEILVVKNLCSPTCQNGLPDHVDSCSKIKCTTCVL